MPKVKGAVYVTKILIKNVLGIETLAFKPGRRWTRISGDNGTGKTSVIESLKSILGGGVHDVKLLRKGTEQAEIGLELSDGIELQKIIKPESAEFKGIHPEMGEIGRPVTYLNRIRDKIASNPVEFLTAKRKDQIDILLNSIPMTVTKEQLSFVPELFTKDIGFDAHALQVIEAIHKSVFSKRADVNRTIKAQDGTIEILSKAAPPEAPEGTTWKAEKKRLEAEIKKLNADTKAAMDSAQTSSNKEYEEGKKVYEDAINTIDDDLQAGVKKLEADAAARREALRKSREKAVEQFTERATKTQAKYREDYNRQYAPLKEQLTTAENRSEEEIRFDESRKTIDTLKENNRTQEKESKHLDDVLYQLSNYKSHLLEKLPVAGLEVKDGDIFFNGIPYETVNEAERVKLAARLSIERAGICRLVVLDGLERLSQRNQKILMEELAEADMQMIGSFVTEEKKLNIDSGIEEAE